MSNNIINGLFWPKLGIMEQMSINSFLANGHSYYLWSYGPVEGVPDGAIIKDANEIMPYKQYDHHAQFADHFRYNLLYQRGGWWADIDVICLRPFDFSNEYVFSSEHKWENQSLSILNNVVIKAPASSPILKWMLEQCVSANPKGLSYTKLGPMLIEEAVRKFNLQHFVEPTTTFCPMPYRYMDRFIYGSDISNTSNSHAVHLWHGMWKQAKLPFNILSGIYGDLHSLYGQGKGKVLIALVTCDKYKDRSKYCLDTWGMFLPEGYDLKVCTGKSLGVPDDYNSLCAKTKAIATYAINHNYDWVIKVDDDTIIHPDKLKIPTGSDYAGWASIDEIRIECPWAHCQGGCYWLSKKAMKIIADATLGDFKSAEDRWVSKVLRGHGILPTHLDDYAIDPINQWASLWRPDYTFDPNWTVLLQSDISSRMKRQKLVQKQTLVQSQRLSRNISQGHSLTVIDRRRPR